MKLGKKQVIILVLILIVAVSIFSYVHFAPKKIFDEGVTIDWGSINFTYGCADETHDFSLSNEELSDDVKSEISELIINAEMKNTLTPASANRTISDGYVYLSISVYQQNPNSTRIRINLSSNEEHSSVQFDDNKMYDIVQASELYTSVYGIVEHLIPSCEEN